MRPRHEMVSIKRESLAWTRERLSALSGQSIDRIHAIESGLPSEQADVDLLESILDSEIMKVIAFWKEVIDNPVIDPSTLMLKRIAFGELLKDRRNQANLSRLKLARLAKISEATIKFIETARTLPTRRSCQGLMKVRALRLTWDDFSIFVGRSPVPPQGRSEVSTMTKVDFAPTIVEDW